MRRREFISLLGGAAVWPLAARAQQAEQMRRIGVLHTPAVDDPDGQTRNAAFLQGLQQFGWTDGRNVRIDTRWSAGDADRVESGNSRGRCVSLVCLVHLITSSARRAASVPAAEDVTGNSPDLRNMSSRLVL
jgi:hypothetical protein